ncbi:M15 family metallopeptidase [Nocardia aurantiaca]|uniref:Peptidase M15 n=1 Tax=Nocardia aurantiaca TaxID=2675850 RepID=A0A6I3KWM8_9NOCA|nr:M15 family metallopeptidase [Nocardia aurantiaca]MTE14442.1 peptidase M15 [Nocardia aurantiaca]
MRRITAAVGAAVAVMATVAVITAPESSAAPASAAPPAVSATAVASETDGLYPWLALAYDLALTEAQGQGVPLWIVSGYRTRAEQEALWEDGIRTYGSADAARRWVLPPDESTHVTGQAIDVGPQQGAAWLEAEGNRWGLCRMYDNEWWHFELATLPGFACPARRPDASSR